MKEGFRRMERKLCAEHTAAAAPMGGLTQICAGLTTSGPKAGLQPAFSGSRSGFPARSVGPRSVSHTETMDNGCQTRGNPKRERGLDRNMDGPRDGHTERNKSDRERQISYDVAYTWNLKK